MVERGPTRLVLQQVSNRTGRLIGLPVSEYTDADLIAARPATLAEYGNVLKVEVELTETTWHRLRYSRNELVALLGEELPDRADEFTAMSLAELVATMQAVLNDHGDVAERVRVEAGGDDDCRDDWSVNIL